MHVRPHRRRRLALLLLLTFALLHSACSRCSTPPSTPEASPSGPKVSASGEVYLDLSASQRDALLLLARKTFDSFVRDKKQLDPAEAGLSAEVLKLRGNMVFATIYYKGDWRGCMGAQQERLADSVAQAVILTAQDKRFKPNNPTAEQLDDYRVELSLLQPRETIDSKDLAEIERNFIPGQQGLHISDGKQQAFFLPYVFVKQHRSLAEWLQRLSAKATNNADDHFWKNPTTIISTFDAVNFIEERPRGPRVDLFRYRIVETGLSAAAIKSALDLSAAYLIRPSGNGEAINMASAGYISYKSSPLTRIDRCDQSRAVRVLAELKRDGLSPASLPPEALDAVTQSLLDDADPTTGAIRFTRGNDPPVPDLCATGNLVAALPALHHDAAMPPARQAWLKKATRWMTETLVAEGGRIKLEGVFFPVTDMDDSQGFVLGALVEAEPTLKDDNLRSVIASMLNICNATYIPAQEMHLDLAWGCLAAYRNRFTETVPPAVLAVGLLLLEFQQKSMTSLRKDWYGSLPSGHRPRSVMTAQGMRILATIYRKYFRTPAQQQDAAPAGFAAETLECALMKGLGYTIGQHVTPRTAFFFPSIDRIQGGFFQNDESYTVRPGASTVMMAALSEGSSALGMERIDALSARCATVQPAQK